MDEAETHYTNMLMLKKFQPIFLKTSTKVHNVVIAICKAEDWSANKVPCVDCGTS